MRNSQDIEFYSNFIKTFEKIIQESGYIDQYIHSQNTKAIMHLFNCEINEALKTSQNSRKTCYKGNSDIYLGETYLIKAILEYARDSFDSAINNCEKSIKIFDRNLLDQK